MSEVSSLNFARVYVVTGDDFLAREKIREQYLGSLRNEIKNLVEEKFDSSFESFDLFIERAITPSLFQDIRLFLIRHTDTLTKDEIEHLSLIISSKPDDVYFLIEYDSKKTKGGSSSILALLGIKKLIAKDADYYKYDDFKKPADYKLASWLTEKVPVLFGRQINSGASDVLIELAGSDLGRLYGELEKLNISLPDGAAITKLAIEQILDATREVSPFELTTALGNKNYAETLKVIKALFAFTVYMPPIVSVIFRYFWKLYKVRLFAENNRDRANAYFKTSYKEKTQIAYEIGVGAGVLNFTDSVNKAYPVMVLSNIIDNAVKYKEAHLKSILHWIREFDIGIKTGRVKGSRDDLEELCYKIIRAEQICRHEGDS